MSQSRMSARGGKKKATKLSRSARAGVIFPVGRMMRYLRTGTHKYRIGMGAPVYMAAVIEYLAGRVLQHSCASSCLLRQLNHPVRPSFISLFFNSVSFCLCSSRDPGAGGERGSGQQEDQDHPAAPPVGRAQRRGAQQAPGRCDHRSGRCAAQHSGRPPPQEDGEAGKEQVKKERDCALTGPGLNRDKRLASVAAIFFIFVFSLFSFLWNNNLFEVEDSVWCCCFYNQVDALDSHRDYSETAESPLSGCWRWKMEARSAGWGG